MRTCADGARPRPFHSDMKTKTMAHTGQTTLDLTFPMFARPATADDRPTRETRLAAAQASLARGLGSVHADPAALAAFLAFRSHFHDYSLNNAVLIWWQRPTARHCMGLRTWAKHGRQVCKGERGITILAPILRRPTKAEIAGGADPDQEAVAGYKTATVFDYTQTRAVRPDALVYVPPVARLETEAPDGLVARLEAAIGSVRYAVHYTHASSYADGWCSFAERVITVRAALTGADRAAVLCHELAHALAHDPARTGDRPSRAQAEIQAEGAAYVALSALGLDTARASLPYLKSWAGDNDALTRELAAIDRIARDLISRVEAAA